MPVVKVTVARPTASVVEVAAEKEPPAPVFDQVTVLPAVATAFPFASASCASTVTSLETAGFAALRVTRYCVAGPAAKATCVECASAAAFSVPVTVAVPAVVPVVSVAV